jgi:hypothetical protein
MTIDPSPRRGLQAALQAAGPAHHVAFTETGGEDPEWPLWYAEHLIEKLRNLLSQPHLTTSRLVWALVAADDAYTAEQPALSWQEFYADRLSELAHPN